MADFELFNGTELVEPDADHRIALNKKSLSGAFFVRWDNFKNLIRSFTVSKDTDQSISGKKTFTGIVNVQAPTSDNNPVTLKYFNDNAGGGEEIIEVATYADLPLVGVTSVLYVVLDENIQYRWSGTVYVAMSNPLSYASQAEMELAEPTENTKVVTPLRAWQGFVYWCKNTNFSEMLTSAKTLVGAINELLELLNIKQSAHVGICEMCPVYSTDVIRDHTTRTLTIQSTKGGTPISASDTLKFYTKTSGVKRYWEKSTAQSVQWSDVKGLKYIYFDTDGVLKSSDTPWVIGDITLIWRLYWNPAETGVGRIVREAWECHPNDQSGNEHRWKHKYGAIHISGLDIVCTPLTTGAPNASGVNTCISFTGGVCMDDNLPYTVTNSLVSADFSQDLGNITAASITTTNAALFEITYNDATGTLKVLPATRFPFHFIGNVPQVISANGTITPVTNNYFFNYYIYAFQDPRYGKVINARSGGQYQTQSEAIAETWEQVKAASPTLSDGEVRQLDKTQWEYRTTYSTAVKGSCLRAFTDLRSNAAVSVTAAGGATIAANVICTAPTGYTATDQQLLDNDLAANTIKGATATHTTIVAADTIGVWDSVGNVFKKASALSFKTYVKLGLKASEILNDSLNVFGLTLKDIFDNATIAVDGVAIQDNDIFAFAREVETAGVFNSVNMYHTWARMKSELVDKHVYQYNVSTWEEIQMVVSDPLCRESVVFNIMQPVYGGILQTYAKNIYFRGAKIIMQSDANLRISGYVADTYNIYLDCLIDTGAVGMPAYITLGDTIVVSTINLKVKQIQGLSTSTIATVELIEIGASNTTSITYNELVNVQLINTSINATQEDTFYALKEYTVYKSIKVGGTYTGPYTLMSLPVGWYIDSIELRNASAQTITGAVIEIDDDNGGWTIINTLFNLAQNSYVLISRYTSIASVYDQYGSNNIFAYHVNNITASPKVVRYRATTMINTTTNIAITIKKGL